MTKMTKKELSRALRNSEDLRRFYYERYSDCRGLGLLSIRAYFWGNFFKIKKKKKRKISISEKMNKKLSLR